MVYSAVLCVVWAVVGSNTYGNMICKYMDPKGLAAILSPAGVTPEVNLRFTQMRKYRRDPLWP